MKYLKQVERAPVPSRYLAFSTRMIAKGFIFLFLSAVIACTPTAPEKVGPSQAPQKAPPAPPKASPAQPKAPSAPPPKTPIASPPPPKAAEERPRTVSPPPAVAKTSPTEAFHLKAPEAVPEEAVKPKPAPPKEPIVIWTPPETKKFHTLHEPIKKGESCVTAKCHEKKLKENRYVHAPVATGACILCHGDIAPNPPFGLTRKGQDLCLVCHKDMKGVFNQARFLHKPVKDNCQGCHNPHSSESKVLLRESKLTLCVKCHEKATPDLIVRIKRATKPHKPVKEGKCADCHTAHVSNFKKLLKEGPKEVSLCFSCHKEMGAKIKKAAYKHGPVRDGLCTACHKPHGSDIMKNLRYFFVEKFYNPFDLKVYSLCFKCHKETVVMDKWTTALTNFRNGNRNLHYLHVHRKKGRTCLACHEVHAGTQERKIRVETPFGDWKIPIRFSKNTTGGSCEASCHVKKKYDRKTPFKLEIDVQEALAAKAKEK